MTNALCLSSGSEELKRMAHSKARVTDGKVTYPPGVKEISDKISKEEMVRRLKVSVFSIFFKLNSASSAAAVPCLM